MSFLKQWFSEAKSVIKSPSQALANEDRRNGFGYPLKFGIFSIFLATAINTLGVILTSAINPLVSTGFLDALIFFVGGVVGGPVILAVLAAFVHIFVYLFGGREGYSKTLAAVMYGTAIAPVASVFRLGVALGGTAAVLGGLVSALIGLWALQIDYRGVQHFHGISSLRAGLAIIFPILLGFFGFIGLTFMSLVSLLL